MTKISKSPERNTFQRDSAIKHILEKTGTITDTVTVAMLEMYTKMDADAMVREASAEWKIDNMEHDLRSTEWIVEKVKAQTSYAQNLYAAMCNREFTKNEVWPILKDQRWSCSWRGAGGIVADMREEGDYIDWYCSGIREDDELVASVDPASGISRQYVNEAVVTDEIREDLLKLGWVVVPEQSDD